MTRVSFIKSPYNGTITIGDERYIREVAIPSLGMWSTQPHNIETFLESMQSIFEGELIKLPSLKEILGDLQLKVIILKGDYT